jgi:hypothetical protein
MNYLRNSGRGGGAEGGLNYYHVLLCTGGQERKIFWFKNMQILLSDTECKSRMIMESDSVGYDHTFGSKKE